jgi:hypothetical protein
LCVQIPRVRRFLAPVCVALALASPLRALEPTLSAFEIVSIKPAVTSLIVATVTMTMPDFTRKGEVYSSTYSAKVFPYFFYNEKGRIWIKVSDEDVLRASKGLPVDVRGHAISDVGDDRRVEGHAIPTGPRTGRIKVKVFVTRRISLNYDTTYELKGPVYAPADPTPKSAR